ncbi:hypothetical protein ABZX77_17915 [Streptomyces sp. NPDC004237]|uniref:hypothetical protein n=1 Tax=Streptomyces sp. NPDC004237 TaxID=3154455 RepID=UPI0033BBFFA4
MSDQNPQEPPNYEAITRRIAEARKQGRRIDYGKVQARIDEQAARRHAARVTEAARRRQAAVEAREAYLRGVVDRAVKEQVARILADPSAVAEVLRGGGEITESAPQAPGKPLHEMTAEEWREHTRETWVSRLPYARRPMTISDWVGRHDGDEA